jgi:hypothetical protein
MNPMLQQRIQNLMGDTPIAMAEGGEVDQITPTEEMQVEEAVLEMSDPVTAINEALVETQRAKETATDEFERKKLDQLEESLKISADAPLAEMAVELSKAGRGEDTTLAHLTPGEVVLPKEMFEDAEFESAVEKRFSELDLNPEQYVVGLGIASLNPSTGLEEFGFFKKIAKFAKKAIKKVVKPVAKVAQFIPGPWQAPAALISKASTVYDVAKGRASPLALAGVVGPTAIGGSITKNLGDITKAGGIGSLVQAAPGAIIEGIKGIPGAISSGIGSLIKDPLGTIESVYQGQGIPGVKGSAQLLSAINQSQGGMMPVSMTMGQGMSRDDMLRAYNADPRFQQPIRDMIAQGLTPDQVLQQLQMMGSPMQMMGPLMPMIGSTGQTQNQGFQTPQILKDFDDRVLQPIKGVLTGTDERAGIFNVGALGDKTSGRSNLLPALGIAGLLGRLAYKESKQDRGVARTPLTTMDAFGRFNIAQEVARQKGEGDLNPIEFGLLPSDTLPQLSGGRKAPTEQMYRGGPVMAFKDGGNVDEKDFQKKTGKINGPGTEVSDDIPAMLSDGEFVFNAQSVRGAGAFDMKKGKNGIMTLTATNEEDRDRGTKLMYDMMNLFKNYARAS